MEKRSYIRSLLAMNLKRSRKNMNFSQLSLATEIDMAPNFINNIEQGRKWMSPESMQKICDALKIQPYQLFLPETEEVIRKDDAIAHCCDETLKETQRIVKQIRGKYLG